MTSGSSDHLDRIEALLQQSIVASDEQVIRIEKAMERGRQESSEPCKLTDTEIFYRLLDTLQQLRYLELIEEAIRVAQLGGDYTLILKRLTDFPNADVQASPMEQHDE